jgi:hypothetical protein
MWPDGELSLDFSPLAPAILAGLEPGGDGPSFVIGDQTILHCFEAQPPERGSHVRTAEVVAILVCKEFFNGQIDWEKLWERISVHEPAATPPTQSILASLQDPAVARFEPQMRIGGDLTPAMLSQRMIELIGNEGIDRICWRDGRKWGLFAPGPVLSHGTALLIETSRLALIRDYDLIWVVRQTGSPIRIVDARRRVVYGEDNED